MSTVSTPETSSLPYSYDAGQKKITVRGAETFPKEIFDHAEEVEILDMSAGHLSTLPEDLGRLSNLKVVFFSNNDFEEVPEVLATCQNLETVGFRSCKIRTLAEHALPVGLRALILTDNEITSLPRSMGELTELRKIMMAGNHLQELPKELLECRNLEIVRFSVSRLASSPDWLLQLPHLAWYADSSNPFSMPVTTHPPEIDWSDIAVGPELGKSNNNIVYQGHLPDGRTVAVKLFGDALVTDGLAADDMNACLQAGNHPNVVGAIGKLVNAPDERQGLVMPLIPAEFKNLGNPPSLATVCRDTYPDGQSLSVAYVAQVLKTTAEAMRYLHSKGIMHGDLYAHNILTNAAGDSYVGDFGAASLYQPGSANGKLREQVDVRAFGCLAEELASACSSSSDDHNAMAQLRHLQQACLDENPAMRPSFADLASAFVAQS